MELLAFLREKKGYVSGQEIADAFGISRNAVWKHIENLRREGVTIEAVSGKGYRLADGKDAFGERSIGAALHTRWLGRELFYFEKRLVYHKTAPQVNLRRLEYID